MGVKGQRRNPNKEFDMRNIRRRENFLFVFFSFFFFYWIFSSREIFRHVHPAERISSAQIPEHPHIYGCRSGFFPTFVCPWSHQPSTDVAFVLQCFAKRLSKVIRGRFLSGNRLLGDIPVLSFSLFLYFSPHDFPVSRFAVSKPPASFPRQKVASWEE